MKLDTWLTCSEANLLNFGGRVGYRLVETAEHNVVFYVFGFGDHRYWAYDAEGNLVGAGAAGDDGSYARCGEPSSFRYSSDALGEQLSPGEGDEAAGGAGGGPGQDGAAGAGLADTCENL